MTTGSILSPAGLRLRQNVIYRARLLVKAPKIVATEGKVSDALAKQGFVDVQFFDKDALPPDWPGEERDDPSGAFSWTAFLQGRFTMTDRLITLPELPGTVQVLSMWEYLTPLVPAAASPASPAPGTAPVSAPPILSFPVMVAPPSTPELASGTKLLGVVIGGAVAYGVLRALMRRSARSH